MKHSPRTPPPVRKDAGALSRPMVALVLAASLALVLAAVLAPLPFDLRRTRPAMVFAALVLGSVGSILAVLFHVGAKAKARRFASLDLAFQGLATKAHTYLRTGRRYEGTWRGRAFDAYCSQVRSLRMGRPAGTYAGEQLEIMLDCGSATRLGAGIHHAATSSLAQGLNRGMARITDLEEQGIAIWSSDPAWGSSLAAHPDAGPLLLDMLEPGTGPGLRSIRVLPGTLMITLRRIPPAMLTTETIQRLLRDLEQLARLLESLPHPMQEEHPTAWELDLRKGRKRIGRIALIIVIAILGGLTLFGAGLAALIIHLT